MNGIKQLRSHFDLELAALRQYRAIIVVVCEAVRAEPDSDLGSHSGGELRFGFAGELNIREGEERRSGRENGYGPRDGSRVADVKHLFVGFVHGVVQEFHHVRLGHHVVVVAVRELELGSSSVRKFLQVGFRLERTCEDPGMVDGLLVVPRILEVVELQ